ncbi:cytochrome P450 [Marinobacter nauticus]|uniref:cytochrome P450 n=1 Tax=Marinobacter nauticus TaxID=2743 RepID=UPI001C9990B8|nr:cytochrome P450 [Marinobacter nauticus]MBY5938274.1 cytochrome P450 [Marinobacter nauticus]MBY5955503.1 cytochrome P450 [Marinobacter nauticus]MBY6009294.1 cytochrome P450 [Marinobacter nauticus]
MAEQHHEDWDPRSAEVQKDQIRAYDAMRKECPVAWSDYQQWTLFRHADVMQVLEDHHTFSNAVSAHLSVPNGMDPPEHTPYRKAIEPYFAPEPMARFEPICRKVARALVQTLDKNKPLDVVNALSRPFALQIQCAFMGWPDSLHQPLAEWVMKNHRATLARDRAAMADVAEEFDGYIRDLLDSRRQTHEPAPDDVTTRLMREQINGQPMTDEELVSLLRNWTVGELATISASISILTNYLAHHHELLNNLKAAPEQLPEAIDEILRMDAPLISNRRVTTREVEISGRTIPAGEKITLLWASANRDEDVFGNPDQFCPQQNAAKNLLYGAGIHICPGAPLARMELRVFMEELLKQIDTIEPVAGEQPERAMFPTGGFNALPLVFR